MAIERTVIILKPDCMEKRHVGAVLTRFEQAGFDIVGCKMVRLELAPLEVHYAHIADLPVYPALIAFMRSRPVLILVLEGEGVVARVRELLGPTDSRKAAPGTIRGDFGTSTMINIAHASDSPENGLVEIARFFAPGEIFG